MKRLVPLVTLMTAACATSPLPPAPAINRDLAAAPFASLPVATIAPVPDDWWRLYDDPVLDQLVEASLAANADLRVEQWEKLEQLRMLENGFKVKIVETEYDSFSVDTPEDLEKARKIYSKLKKIELAK